MSEESSKLNANPKRQTDVSKNLIINSNNSNESNEIQGNTVQELHEEEPEKFNWSTVLRSMS